MHTTDGERPPEPAPRTLAARRTALRDLLVAALVFALAWWTLAPADPSRPDEDGLYGDETCWVAISIQHWAQLVDGAPPAGAQLDPPRWREEGAWARGVQRTAFGYPSPCLGKLFLGAVLSATGFREASPLVFTVFLQHDVEGGRAARAALEPALPIARRVVLAFAALATVLLFFVARAALPGGWGWLVALLACTLLLASPIVRETAGDVRTDWFMLAFVLAAVLATLKARGALAGRRGRKPLLLAGLGLGLLAGLAVASKLNGGLIVLCVVGWVLLLRRRGGAGIRARGATLGALALAGVATCAVFWALNPRLWAEPFGGVADILARWRELFAYFQDDWAVRSGTAVGRTPGESVALFVDRTIHRDDPWHALTGLRGGTLLLLGGLGVLGWRAWIPDPGPDRALRAEPARVLFVFVLVFLCGSALWLPIDWPRYFLPAAPCLALLQALALAALVRVGARLAGAPRPA